MLNDGGNGACLEHTQSAGFFYDPRRASEQGYVIVFVYQIFFCMRNYSDGLLPENEQSGAGCPLLSVALAILQFLPYLISPIFAFYQIVN